MSLLVQHELRSRVLRAGSKGHGPGPEGVLDGTFRAQNLLGPLPRPQDRSSLKLSTVGTAGQAALQQ